VLEQAEACRARRHDIGRRWTEASARGRFETFTTVDQRGDLATGRTQRSESGARSVWMQCSGRSSLGPLHWAWPMVHKDQYLSGWQGHAPADSVRIPQKILMPITRNRDRSGLQCGRVL